MAARLANDALFVRTDVTQAESAEATLAAALARFGRIDLAAKTTGVAKAHVIGEDEEEIGLLLPAKSGRGGPHAGADQLEELSSLHLLTFI